MNSPFQTMNDPNSVESYYSSSDEESNLCPEVRQAYTASREQNAITPLVKEELRLSIMKSRHNRGLDMPDTTHKKIKKENLPLSDRDIQRKERRKAQNRKAAERCRKKKQKQNEQLHKDFEIEQQRTRQLEAEVAQLRKEKQELETIIHNHALVCLVGQNPTPETTPSYDQTATFDYPPQQIQIPGFPVPEMAGQSQTNVFEPLTPIPRDVTTPFQQDPFDDDIPVFQEFPNCMYPANPVMKTETAPSCHAGALEEPVLPELEGTINFESFQPISPDMTLGRQSISDYLDLDEFNANH